MTSHASATQSRPAPADNPCAPARTDHPPQASFAASRPASDSPTLRASAHHRANTDYPGLSSASRRLHIPSPTTRAHATRHASARMTKELTS